MLMEDTLKENSGLFEPDVFPINVAVVSLCVRLTLLSAVIEILVIHKQTFITQINDHQGELLRLLQLSK